jgi:hypothetical protein
MKGAESKKSLTPKQRNELLEVLGARFARNLNRHPGLQWVSVKARLEASTAKLWSLSEMERTGGEPDVVGHDKKTGEFIFIDCVAQSPKGRTSLCYDREALDSRKEFKPKNSVMDLAPADIRKQDGALFGDRRYGHVWVYHNGAQSYYSGRGFRASLRV